MASDKTIEDLHEINKRFISDDPSNALPAVTLPDGSKIQTGTVGALLQNIKQYDQLCAGNPAEGSPSKAELEHFMTVPLSTLKKVGLFDLFTPDEWIAGESAGRRFIGTKAKELGY